jgi:hypothetical protein
MLMVLPLSRQALATCFGDRRATLGRYTTRLGRRALRIIKDGDADRASGTVYGTWFGLRTGGGGAGICGTPLMPPGLVVPAVMPGMVGGMPPGLAAAAFDRPAGDGLICA